MTAPLTYDPGEVKINLFGFPIEDYADGEFISVEGQPLSTTVVGADGIATRVMSRNRSAKITIKLKQSSPSNAALSSIAAKDKRNRTGVGPCRVADLSGTSLYEGDGWIESEPKPAFGKELTTREWVIAIGTLERLDGGNL